jgi:hypothetical protein
MSLAFHGENASSDHSCKGLKYLRFEGRLGICEPFEDCPCDLSYLTHLELDTDYGPIDLSVMEAYNIGGNLEFLHLHAYPESEIILRAPKLKRIKTNGSNHFIASLCLSRIANYPIRRGRATVRFITKCERRTEATTRIAGLYSKPY